MRAWTDQLAPDGIMVVPIGTGVAVLTRNTGGDPTVVTFGGQFETYYSYFMPMRAAHERDELALVARRAVVDDGTLGTTTLSAAVFGARDERFWLELAVPGVVRGTGGASGSAELVYHRDGSWARLDGGSLVQGGPRRLWTEVEVWHERWNHFGRPGPDRVGLTVEPDLQTTWLDHPGHGLHRSARTVR